jgi:hypothetical protein
LVSLDINIFSLSKKGAATLRLLPSAPPSPGMFGRDEMPSLSMVWMKSSPLLVADASRTLGFGVTLFFGVIVLTRLEVSAHSPLLPLKTCNDPL